MSQKQAGSPKSSLRKRIFTKANFTKIFLPSFALLLIILTPIVFEAFKTRHQRLDNVIIAPPPGNWIDRIFPPTQDIDTDNESNGIMDNFTNGISDPDTILFRVSPNDHYLYWRLEAYDEYLTDNWDKDYSTTEYTGYSSLPFHADGQLSFTSDIEYFGGSFSANFPAPYNYLYGEEFSENYEFTPTSDWLSSQTTLEKDIYGAISVDARFQNQAGNATFDYPVAYTLQDNEYIKDNSDGYFTLNNLISLNSDLNRYLQIPQDYSTLAPLTNQISSTLRNTSDTIFNQVFLDMLWLTKNNTYDIDMLFGNSDDQPAEGEDYVEWFLNRRMGTAAHFAASLAIISRLQGIPSRFIFGFSYGDRSGSEFIVRVKHVHCWVEVFIPIAGTGYWIAFDPSPLIPGLRDRYGENTFGFQSAFYCSNEFFLSPEHMLRQTSYPYFVPNPASSAWYPNPYDPSVWYGPYVNRTDSFKLYAFLGNGNDQDFFTYLITGSLGNLVPVEGEIIRFIDTSENVILGTAVTDSTGFAVLNYSFPVTAFTGLHYIVAEWFNFQVPTYDLRFLPISYVETGVIVTGITDIDSVDTLEIIVHINEIESNLNLCFNSFIFNFYIKERCITIAKRIVFFV